MWSRRLQAFVALLLIASGCGVRGPEPAYSPPSEIDCSLYDTADFNEIVGKRFANNQEAIDWIVQSYSVAEDAIKLEFALAERPRVLYASLSWENVKSRGSLALANRAPYGLRVSATGTEPSLAQMLACLGPPESYSAYYTVGLESMGAFKKSTLYYPERGILVSTSRYAESGLEAVKRMELFANGQTPENTAGLVSICPAASTIADLLANCYFDPSRPEAVDNMRIREELVMLKPWPGDANEMYAGK